MKNLLVSACLLGIRCRYDGQSKLFPGIRELQQRYHLLPVCPEQLGGLPTPRCPAERQGDKWLTRDGQDVTAQYQRGAEEVLKIAQLFSCDAALLKERSPACGSKCIYDGTFSHVLVPGSGAAVEKLQANGICVWGESEIHKLL